MTGEVDLMAQALADAAGLATFLEAALPDPPPGYTLHRLVSRGGQGIVFEGTHEATGRRVAIKLLREEAMTSRRDRDRFDRELELVNRIDHPGVVPVRDCIQTPDRVWHVMDFIEGVPLDTWARSRNGRADPPSGAEAGASVDETLRLLAAVAEAVSAAHVRGIIHRDLKPSNILVDGSDQPHVLDFGLAKLIEGTTGTDRALTQSGQFVGSLPWASPEQADGRSRDVDTRTDVYALGVILYQALTGRFPYEVDGPVREALDRIAHAEPIPPRRHRRDIDADTETIVLTCLRKDPSRRYQGAAELGADLRRRLAGTAIAARGDSVLYLLGKSLRRHRVLVSAALAAAVLLPVAATTLAILYRERDRQATMAGEISDFFINELIGNLDPMRGVGRDARVLDVVSEASDALEGRFSDPRVDAALRCSIGSAFRELGEIDRAEPHLERAAAELETLLPAGHPERLHVASALARLRLDQGRSADAEQILRPAIEAGGDDPRVILLQENLAAALAAQERWPQALQLLTEVRAAREAAVPRDEMALLITIGNIASVLQNRQSFAEAEPLYRLVLAGSERLHGPEHLRAARAAADLAACLISLGHIDEARPLVERSIAIRKLALGEDHERTLEAVVLLADLEQRAGQDQAATDLLEQVLARRAASGRGDDAVSLALARRVGVARMGLGEHARAVDILDSTHRRQREVSGPDQIETLETQRLLAKALRLVGRHGDSETLLRDAIVRIERVQGTDAPMAVLALAGLALVRSEQGHLPEALAIVEQAIERGSRARGSDDPPVLVAIDAGWSVAQRANDRVAARRYAALMVEAHERKAPAATHSLQIWTSRRDASQGQQSHRRERTDPAGAALAKITASSARLPARCSRAPA